MSRYRIITFDGGGIRGALSANLIKRLNNAFPGLVQSTAFFAGTSTGSFMALGLAYGLKPEDLVHLYSEERAKFIFKNKRVEVFRPKYENDRLRGTLSTVFPDDLRLEDLQRHVLVPSFRVTGKGEHKWQPIFYHNFPDSPFLKEKVIDVALCSSAAPVYFPSYQNHIDGGVIANNPSTAAIAHTIDTKFANQMMGNICLLSLGTGFSSLQITADTTAWGAFDWALSTSPPFPLLNVLFDGGSEADVYYSKQILKDQYFRLNPRLNKPITLDEYKKIPYLISLAQSYNLRPTLTWLHQNWL
ncbi:patatin-like phospholipase family protein [Desulforamulus aeronauticus]|uniref:Patatin-like phospholipase n=1 Tax=Desulforamulus aeronauticus DSM 10349 TaxID=1121421 RepID=A0A1M6T008_9FIRM|nr:patatin-like phospholipase family protein [Desulforamulus aeronauticus]SHK50239.1 Patatin-like phospholipase [Desulforamulus aeronauticus DSM 10349]